ncbi:MAG: ATPase, partial [Pirellula sp.]
RDGINVLRYAIKRLAQAGSSHPLSKDQAWREAVAACLGDEALDLSTMAQRKQQALGGNTLPMGLDDFFFDPDDPLRPEDE